MGAKSLAEARVSLFSGKGCDNPIYIVIWRRSPSRPQNYYFYRLLRPEDLDSLRDNYYYFDYWGIKGNEKIAFILKKPGGEKTFEIDLSKYD